MKIFQLFITSLLVAGACMFFLKPLFGQENCRPFGKGGIPFVPKDKDTLEKKLNTYFEKAEPLIKLSNDETVLGIISPHAGYEYAGKIMASGYQYFKNKNYKRVFVIGFSHRYPINGIDVGNWDFVSCPLGKIPVDKDAVKELLKNEIFKSTQKAAQDIEWSTENQLPFIFSTLKGCKVIILLVGDLSDDENEKAAIVLRKYISSENAFVISSDFTHYGLNYSYTPFTQNIKENLYKLDGEAIDLITNKDYTGFNKYIDNTGATICGKNPISLFLKMIEKENINGKKIAYMTSGDSEGEYEMASVGYASILFTKKYDKTETQKISAEEKKEEVKKMNKEQDPARKKIREELFGPADEPDSPILSEEEKKTLITLARDMLNNCTKDRKYRPDLKKYNITENLKKPCRVFVTLKIDGDLRGCIGFSHAEYPLAEAVIKSTYNSCFEDPRFPDVRPDEAKKIHIDISVNTPPRLAPNGYKDIKLGEHGIYLVKWTGGFPRIATFLPMVAPEQGWNLEQTLSHLSQKAGLSSNAWKDPETEFYLYTSQVIEEEK